KIARVARRHRPDDPRKRIVVERVEAIVPNGETQVSSPASAGRIRNVSDARPGKVDRRVSRIEQAQTKVLLLTQVDEILAIAAKGQEHVTAHQMRVADEAGDDRRNRRR